MKGQSQRKNVISATLRLLLVVVEAQEVSAANYDEGWTLPMRLLRDHPRQRSSQCMIAFGYRLNLPKRLQSKRNNSRPYVLVPTLVAVALSVSP